MGAGNGTLMLNILDYIRDTDPEVYARTKFKVIEISSSLASLSNNTSQNRILQRTRRTCRNHQSLHLLLGHLRPIPMLLSLSKSSTTLLTIVSATTPLPKNPSRNRPHRQRRRLLRVLHTGHRPSSSTLPPRAQRSLHNPIQTPLRSSKLLRGIKSRLPFAANLTEPEYIPTRLMQFFDILHKYFPAHRLLTSDFTACRTRSGCQRARRADEVPAAHCPCQHAICKIPPHPRAPFTYRRQISFSPNVNDRSYKATSTSSSRPTSPSWKICTAPSPAS
jgi:hypothetical protein